MQVKIISFDCLLDRIKRRNQRIIAGNAHGIGLHRLLENNGNMLENVALI